MSKPTIAVVEDNADNRLLLTAMLGDRYTMVEYDNGPDALEGLAKSLPDLVLLDISLPGMDGNEILAEIRRDGRMRHLPVIALTAHAMAGDRERFLDAASTTTSRSPLSTNPSSSTPFSVGSRAGSRSCHPEEQSDEGSAFDPLTRHSGGANSGRPLTTLTRP